MLFHDQTILTSCTYKFTHKKVSLFITISLLSYSFSCSTCQLESACSIQERLPCQTQKFLQKIGVKRIWPGAFKIKVSTSIIINYRLHLKSYLLFNIQHVYSKPTLVKIFAVFQINIIFPCLKFAFNQDITNIAKMMPHNFIKQFRVLKTHYCEQTLFEI